VGSGKDLAKRLAIYYKKSELIKYPRHIHRALLKYGYANFRLEILEYCNNDLIKKEQYYIDLLKPDYNILKKAYSLAGFKHSKESKAVQRAKAIANRGVKV
jgi:group I intron endonuclease